jgi:hypothetical protein
MKTSYTYKIVDKNGRTIKRAGLYYEKLSEAGAHAALEAMRSDAFPKREREAAKTFRVVEMN